MAPSHRRVVPPGLAALSWAESLVASLAILPVLAAAMSIAGSLASSTVVNGFVWRFEVPSVILALVSQTLTIAAAVMLRRHHSWARLWLMWSALGVLVGLFLSTTERNAILVAWNPGYLVQPEDTAAGGAWRTETLPLTAPVHFAWEPVPGARRYDVFIHFFRSTGAWNEVVMSETASPDWVIDLPANSAGESYRFGVHAIGDGVVVGQFKFLSFTVSPGASRDANAITCRCPDVRTTGRGGPRCRSAPERPVWVT